MKAIVKQESIDLGWIQAALWRAGQGRPVFCFHGWLDNANSFLPLAESLDLSQIELISVDFPGHGHSAHRSTDQRQYFTDLVWFIHCLLAHFDECPICLMGHSMGAGGISLYAGTFPERVSHLVLLDGLGPLSGPAHESPQRLRQALEQHTEGKAPRVWPDLQTAAKLRSRGEAMNLENALLLVERGMQKTEDGSGYRWRHDHRLQEPSMLRLTEEQVLAFLQAIEARTMLVQAQNDRSTEYQRLFADRLQSIASLDVLQMTGQHHLHMDLAADLAPRLQPFLDAYVATL